MAEPNKVNLLFISSSHSNKTKVSLLKRLASEHPANFSIEQQSASQISNIGQFTQLVDRHDFVVLDAVSSREAKSTYQTFLSVLSAVDTVVFSPSWLTEPNAQRKLDSNQQQRLQAYWQNGGRYNLSNFLSYITTDVLNLKGSENLVAESPLIFPTQGIYHPDMDGLIAQDLDAYFSWRAPKANQAKVGLLFNRASIEIEQTSLIDDTIKRLEDKGVLAVPFFFKLAPGEHDYTKQLYLPGSTTPDVDLIINFRNIHWANQRKTEFQHFGIPVLQAMTYYAGGQTEWESDIQGVDAGMMAFTLVLPETAGVTDPMIVAASDPKTQSLGIIDYQLQHLVSKAVNLTNLKYKPAEEKKITVFVWGDQDVGASFLNVPQSVSAITRQLNSEGYKIPARDEPFFTDRVKRILDPFYRDYELQTLLDEDLAELMPISQYLDWFKSLPRSLQQDVVEHWGQPQDNFMATQIDGTDYFVLPRIRNGNMLIMRQPPRSDDKDDESGMFHQGIVPINHFYLAAYFYARDYWQSDAIVHLGTHGSQEYLGGKERGLSMFDQGNLAVWDTPVVYPFIVDDVGEAMQTKRRGRATVISHMTPPFAAAGLHGDIAELHELMHQYKQLDQGGVKQKTARQIATTCIENNLCKDIGIKQAQIEKDFDAFFTQLHSHLESIASANQPLGLHTFGLLADERLLVSTLVQMLGSEFVTLAAEFEHTYYSTEHDEVVETDEETHSHLFHKPASQDGTATQGEFPPLEQMAGYQTVLTYVVRPLSGLNIEQQPQPLSNLSPELQRHIKQGQSLFNDMRQIRELTSISDFLRGKYIPVKTGGDPIRHPESLATGFNLYGFDPAKVPTKAAFEQGKELIDQMVADHVQKHGRYPDKMAFSLWSIETMRHYGVLESQALYAMGVRPIWSKSGRVIGTEIIPYSELKRPRVDVVLSATGLYRDAFPTVIQRIAKAVQQVAELKEDNNPIWRNSEKVKRTLLSQGVSEIDAEYLSTVRVFSNQSGDYGSGVDELAWASDKWENDSVIAGNYMNKMGYYFGADKSRWGKKITSASGQPINLYGQQLSGTDIALFSRSSNVYGMLSSDDPFEYFGALALAVRNLDGKSPEMLISNLRNAQKPEAQSAAQFMATELRTRSFHPRWITEMQKEGYAGAVTMSARMDNFFGWQVMDPNLVRSDQWDEFFDVYVNDKLNLELDEWFEQINPEALARMMERMLEAERKDYWQASDERLKQLVETYSEFIEKYNLFVDNEKLKANVTELATGFGLTPPEYSPTVASDAPVQNTSAPNEPETVTGQKLVEQTTTQPVSPDYTIWLSLAALLLILMAGFLFEQMQGRKQLLPA